MFWYETKTVKHWNDDNKQQNVVFIQLALALNWNSDFPGTLPHKKVPSFFDPSLNYVESTLLCKLLKNSIKTGSEIGNFYYCLSLVDM